MFLDLCEKEHSFSVTEACCELMIDLACWRGEGKEEVLNVLRFVLTNAVKASDSLGAFDKRWRAEDMTRREGNLPELFRHKRKPEVLSASARPSNNKKKIPADKTKTKKSNKDWLSFAARPFRSSRSHQMESRNARNVNRTFDTSTRTLRRDLSRNTKSVRGNVCEEHTYRRLTRPGGSKQEEEVEKEHLILRPLFVSHVGKCESWFWCRMQNNHISWVIVFVSSIFWYAVFRKLALRVTEPWTLTGVFPHLSLFRTHIYR